LSCRHRGGRSPNYQRTFTSNLFNEVRIGAPSLRERPHSLQPPPDPRHSASQQPRGQHAADLSSAATCRRSPPNTASDFKTSVTEIADSLTWVKGRHTFKMGFDWRCERLDVIQPPSPTGSFTFNVIGSNLPGAANTGTPFSSFLLGQVQTFSIDVQQAPIQERARSGASSRR
jgi:hypothetical protein